MSLTDQGVNMSHSIRRRYERLGTLAVDEVVQVIKSFAGLRKAKAEFLGQQVNCVSLRLRTFALKGTVCSKCALAATHFALEKTNHPSHADGPYHLNLWGVDSEGKEILFTHDHTLARSLGGADNLSNTTTMCEPCNSKKAIGEQVEAERRRAA